MRRKPLLHPDSYLLEKKLSNRNFLERAPREVVEKNRAELEELTEVVRKLEGTLKQLKNMQ